MAKLSDEQYKAIKTIMNNDDLREQMRRQDPNIVALMAGMLFSSWLPRGFFRKVLMFGFILVGVFIAIQTENAWFLVICAVAIFFSPRMTSYVLQLIGTVQRAFDEGRGKGVSGKK